ncbi:MAG TPA: SpoIIE family protein phosphatase [Candidatus Dormibacteraeota bacterium]|nr:SpoIIE family protein phosphatase [Candidatus Dormibacteraeota bacterium]
MQQHDASNPVAPPSQPSQSWAGRLGRIRHDLRNPLSEILGFTEILQEEAAEHNLQPILPGLESIHQAATRIFAEVNHWLAPNALGQTPESLRQLENTIQMLSTSIISIAETLSVKCDSLANNSVGDDLLRIAGSARRLRDTAPVMLAELAPLFIDGQSQAEAKDTPKQPSRTNPKAIERGTAFGSLLIVDDNEANRALLARHLRRQGYTVALADNGRQALEKLQARAFDLVLLDVIMPEMSGYEVLETMKQDSVLRHIPVIMISALDDLEMLARCIERGAEDYLSKPFDAVLLQARIGSSLERKRLHDQEQRTYRALVESQERLQSELAEASAYVQSLLPAPLEGEVSAQWRFQPSAELGGDIFGYHWLAPNRLAIYLVDVSGHGVGAALLSVSIFNVLRAQSLRGTNFADPAAVLNQLNQVFQMERHNNLVFTAWYGVLDCKQQTLTYASGGHPPAVLAVHSAGTIQQLSSGGRILGCDPEAQFRNKSCETTPGSRLYVFSDGAYEISRPDGTMAQLPDFVRQLGAPAGDGVSKLDDLVKWAHTVGGKSVLDDDVSIMEFGL